LVFISVQDSTNQNAAFPFASSLYYDSCFIAGKILSQTLKIFSSIKTKKYYFFKANCDCNCSNEDVIAQVIEQMKELPRQDVSTDLLNKMAEEIQGLRTRVAFLEGHQESTKESRRFRTP
jgi:hypothetical protein